MSKNQKQGCNTFLFQFFNLKKINECELRIAKMQNDNYIYFFIKYNSKVI